MGTGKTTVGRELAARLGMRFVDTDELIAERHGPISVMFTDRGEAGFRAMEADVATELAAEQGLVVATGGAMMLDPANEASLGSTGPVICLSAEPDTIVARLDAAAMQQRPLLDGDDPARSVRELMATRATGYARFRGIDTTGRGVHEIVDEIVALLDGQSGS